MARQANPDLEDRILKAARRLWKKGASKALTMRAVARAARTNTPAVYRRYPHRDDILRALMQQIRQEIYRELARASSIEKACELYIEYALSHPNEYELYYLHEYELLFSAAPARGSALNQVFREKRPAVELIKRKLAAQLGGSPNAYVRLTLALWALLHGTVLLLIHKTIQPEHAKDLRLACAASVKTLLRGAYGIAERE
jgi:AcrR family transcriptional regulator